MSEKLHACPLCGGAAKFRPEKDYRAAEGGDPDWQCGCAKCGLWLDFVSGSDWSPKHGTVSLQAEAKARLAAKWNTRSLVPPAAAAGTGLHLTGAQAAILAGAAKGEPCPSDANTRALVDAGLLAYAGQGQFLRVTAAGFLALDEHLAKRSK